MTKKPDNDRLLRHLERDLYSYVGHLHNLFGVVDHIAREAKILNAIPGPLTFTKRTVRLGKVRLV